MSTNLLRRSVQQAIFPDMANRMHPESGVGLRGALFAAALVTIALGTYFSTVPPLRHQQTADSDAGVTFGRNVNAAFLWSKKVNQIAPLAMDQIAINAAEQGISYNQCADNFQGCAGEYDIGTDNNVPSADASLYPFTWAQNLKNYSVPYFRYLLNPQTGKMQQVPDIPQLYGAVVPVWNSTLPYAGPGSSGATFMQKNSPVGFWWVYAETPAGQSFNLSDFDALAHYALQTMGHRWFGITNGAVMGAIEPMSGGAANSATGWTGDVTPTANAQMRLVTWGLKLSFPVTGDTPALNDPSLYGLVDPTSGAADTKNWIGSPNWSAVWKNIQTPQADQQQGLIDTGHGVIRPNKDDAWILYGKPKSNSNGTSDLKTVFDPAWGYYFASVAGPIRQVPAGLALNQWSSASCNAECSTCYIYQNQTNGSGGVKQVTVDSYATYCPPPPPPTSYPSTSYPSVPGGNLKTIYGYDWNFNTMTYTTPDGQTAPITEEQGQINGTPVTIYSTVDPETGMHVSQIVYDTSSGNTKIVSTDNSGSQLLENGNGTILADDAKAGTIGSNDFADYTISGTSLTASGTEGGGACPVGDTSAACLKAKSIIDNGSYNGGGTNSQTVYGETPPKVMNPNNNYYNNYHLP
jgi:hypothetical protein